MRVHKEMGSSGVCTTTAELVPSTHFEWLTATIPTITAPVGSQCLYLSGQPAFTRMYRSVCHTYTNTL